MKYIVLANRRVKNTFENKQEIEVLTDASILMHCRNIAMQYLKDNKLRTILGHTFTIKDMKKIS